ncbi:MAG: glycosyltransferase [Thermoanaerobacteraceae bacterium]|nr:glycosyltransferase [Thermoanaerobacteraceae bacterium]
MEIFTISLCLITKDEEKNIVRCISSVKDIVDEIVIVDTGSTDKTVEIAKKLGAKVIETQWEDDFSKARNIALDNASSDWILFLDADEEIARDDVDKIKELINSDGYDAYLLKIINFAGSISSGLSEIHYNIRLFRNKKSIRYRYPVHEQIIDLNTGNNPVAKMTDIKILHYGYLSEIRTEKNKTERYIKLISKYLDAHPNDVFQQFNLAVEYYNNGQYEKALKLLKKASKFVDAGLNYATRLVRYMIECYLELKMYDEAYKYIIGAQNLYKDLPDFVFLEGMLYYYQHRYEKAIEMFKKCLDIGEYSNGIYVSMGGTGSYRALFNMAVCHEKLGDLNNAVKEYIEVLKSNRNFSDAFNRLMNILVKNEKPEDVERFFNDYVDYTMPNNHLIMCKLYMDIGMCNIAERYLNNIKYDIPGLNIFRGLIEMGRRNYSKAIDYFNLADDESTKNDILYYKALCNLLMNRYDDAKEVINDLDLSPMRLMFESIVDNKPYKNIEKIREPLFNLLRFLCKTNGFDMFNKVVGLYENEFYREDYENLGILLKENDFTEPSINAFVKAAQLNSTNDEVYRNLAEYSIDNNMLEDAKNFAINAVNLDEYNADNYRILLKVSILSNDGELKNIVKTMMEEKCPELIEDSII